MSKEYQRIGVRLRDFIERQPVFFVATAPLTGDGHVRGGQPRRGLSRFASTTSAV